MNHRAMFRSAMQPRFFAGLLAVMVICPAHAEFLFGRVVNVHDGDTITLLDAEKKQHKIRLAGIDAPELSQPYGQVSRKHLAELVADEPVKVEWHKHDKYQRIVGKVIKGEKDICLNQIANGMAWHFVKYRSEQPEADQVIYAIMETQARDKKLGLWQDKEPIPPWEWRKEKRNNSDSGFIEIASNACALSPDIEHGGGLNACGCHFNRKTGACHCHRPRSCGCSCQPATCR